MLPKKLHRTCGHPIDWAYFNFLSIINKIPSLIFQKVYFDWRRLTINIKCFHVWFFLEVDSTSLVISSKFNFIPGTEFLWRISFLFIQSLGLTRILFCFLFFLFFSFLPQIRKFCLILSLNTSLNWLIFCVTMDKKINSKLYGWMH